MDRRRKRRMDRYWDKMRKYALRSFGGLASSDRFDYWHCHVDWQGKGDKRPENKEAAIALGYEILQMADTFKITVLGPTQSWWFIHEHSYEDAVYLHSANENSTPFPYDFEGVRWGENDVEFLQQLVDTVKYKIGMLTDEYETIYVVTENAWEINILDR